MNKTMKLFAAIAAASSGAAFSACPVHPNVIDGGASAIAGFDNECQVSGVLLSPLTMDAANLWVLEGKVEIGTAITSAETSVGSKQFVISEITTSDANATTLTIEPGTTVIGDNASGAAVDYLVINRGSDIIADATAEAPIRMTSRQDVSGLNAETAQWGGLYINGYGVTNECDSTTAPTAAAGDCERAGEAQTGRYGGASNDDNSGIIDYVTVAYAGNAFDSATDLNGIAFQAVGSATSVSNIQVHQSFDDGVEFYGGAVEVKNVVVTDAGDDSFDTTGGWQGTAQYVILVQTDNTDALLGDRLFESDNNTSPNDATPLTNGVVSNVTMIAADAKGSDGLKIRRGSSLTVANAVINKVDGACFDITDGDGNGDLNASLISILAQCDGSVVDAVDSATWVNTNNVGEVTAGSTSLNGYINGYDELGTQATDLSFDSRIESTDFIGAVKDCQNDWAAAWTIPGTLPAIDSSACIATANIPVMGVAGMLALFTGLVGIAGVSRAVR